MMPLISGTTLVGGSCNLAALRSSRRSTVAAFILFLLGAAAAWRHGCVPLHVSVASRGSLVAPCFFSAPPCRWEDLSLYD
jgi:hypothetical protein